MNYYGGWWWIVWIILGIVVALLWVGFGKHRRRDAVRDGGPLGTKGPREPTKSDFSEDSVAIVDTTETSEQILRRRYEHGEIDHAAYESMLHDLKKK